MTGQGWAEVMSWYRMHGQHKLPWRESRSPWATLVAEYLLIRTRVSAVSRVYSGLLEAFPCPDRVVGDRSRWLDLTTSLGLPSRMYRFVETCEAVIGSHAGVIPVDRNRLLELPGVGHYTAAAVRCFAYGLPETLVDSNTIRIANRLSGVQVSPSRHRSSVVIDHVAGLYEGARGLPEENYALLDIGTTVCKSSVPVCGECPLNGTCSFASGKVYAAEDSSGDATE